MSLTACHRLAAAALGGSGLRERQKGGIGCAHGRCVLRAEDVRWCLRGYCTFALHCVAVWAKRRFLPPSDWLEGGWIGGCLQIPALANGQDED
jgi:hypothetical protein